MKKYLVRWKHHEGDGISTLAEGIPTGMYHEVIQAADAKDARATFDACHRHRDQLISIEQIKTERVRAPGVQSKQNRINKRWPCKCMERNPDQYRLSGAEHQAIFEQEW